MSTPSRGLARKLWALGPVAVGALAAIPLWWPQQHFSVWEHRDAKTHVIVWSLGLIDLVWLAAILWVVFLGALGRLTQGRRGPGRIALGLATAALVLGFGMSRFALMAVWNAGSRHTSPAGDTYADLWVGWMDPLVAVARRTTDWGVAEKYEILTVGTPFFESVSPRVVRPSGSAGRGLFVSNGFAAYVQPSPARCLCAARQDGGPLVDARIAGPNGSPVTPMLRSSPFFLVGPQDAVEDADVADLAAAIAAPVQTDGRRAADLPTDEGLIEALGSSNESVRTAAERLVRAGGPRTYPGATGRLSK